MMTFDLTVPTAVPTASGGTKVRRPESPPASDTHNLITPDGEFTFEGVLVGFGTSRRTDHRGHDSFEFMPAGQARCSACRWFEVRIFIADEPDEVGGSFVIHTYGGTIVPGERPKCHVYVTSSPFEVVAFLTVTKNGERYVPQPSVRALAQAANWNPQLRAVYVELDIG